MIQIRKSKYRNKSGFLVCGENMGIFFEKKAQAQEFVSRYKKGEKAESILKEIWQIK